MSDTSDFGASRCVLRERGDKPWVEIVQTFELESDLDTDWRLVYRQGTYFGFNACGDLPPHRLQEFTEQLHELIQTQQGEAALCSLDQELVLSLRVDYRGRGHLDLLFEGFMGQQDCLEFAKTELCIKDLVLEDNGLQKLYEWVRDWTQMLGPVD